MADAPLTGPTAEMARMVMVRARAALQTAAADTAKDLGLLERRRTIARRIDELNQAIAALEAEAKR